MKKFLYTMIILSVFVLFPDSGEIAEGCGHCAFAEGIDLSGSGICYKNLFHAIAVNDDADIEIR